MNQIKQLQESIHAWAIRKEWRGPKSSKRPLVADLMLFVSEIAEALEELRKNDDPLHYYETYTLEYRNPIRPLRRSVSFKNLTHEQVVILTGKTPNELGLKGKPEGVGPEFADLVIRVLETCEEYGINLSEEIERKMAYNEDREIKHGGLLM